MNCILHKIFCQSMYQNVSIETKWYLVMTRFLIFMSNLIFSNVAIFCQCLSYNLCQKRHLWNMFPTKWQGQNDRMGRPVISFFRQNLDFSIGSATEIENFTLPTPLLCFLCLINSFYKRYVPCMYNRYNISNISDISNISTID